MRGGSPDPFGRDVPDRAEAVPRQRAIQPEALLCACLGRGLAPQSTACASAETKAVLAFSRTPAAAMQS